LPSKSEALSSNFSTIKKKEMSTTILPLIRRETGFLVSDIPERLDKHYSWNVKGEYEKFRGTQAFGSVLVLKGTKS
jgi:hypothetical protein